MNDAGLSLSALAKILRRAKSGLHKLAKAGKIPQLSNGRYDLAAVQRALESNLEPSRAKRSQGERNPAGPGEQVNGRTPRPTISAPADAEQAVSVIREVLEREGAFKGIVDFNAARTAELILKSYGRWLDNEERTKGLIDAKAACEWVSDWAREVRDAWLNWPSRIGALLADDIGSDSVKTMIALEKHVREHLSELADPDEMRNRIENKIEAL